MSRWLSPFLLLDELGDYCLDGLCSDGLPAPAARPGRLPGDPRDGLSLLAPPSCRMACMYSRFEGVN